MRNIFSKIKIISNRKKLILFAVFVLAIFFSKTVFAVWNGTFYDPGDTLNPECLPTDTDCDVRSPLTSLNISDTAYDATTWDSVTTIAPSKNAVRDQIETLVASNHNPITLGTANGLSLATQVLSLALASTSTTGALSDTDWDTFNGKQDALNGTGFVKATGTTISYDNSTYLTSVGTGVANELTYWSGTNALGSLATATYPSLTELSYVKGVTSGIQAQLNTIPSITGLVPYTGATANVNLGTYGLIAGPSTFSVGHTTSALTDILVNPTTKTSGNLIDAQVGSVSKFSVSNAGAVTATGALTITDAGAKSTYINRTTTDNVFSLTTEGIAAAPAAAQYPPAYNDTYVKATTYYGANYEAWNSVNPAKPLTGAWDTNQWLSGSGSNTNQRYHIDLGSAKVITRFDYDNSHSAGTYTGYSVKNFTLQGSNDGSSFADLTYATNTGWTDLTTDASLFLQHPASDVADTHTVTVTNSTPYRYYAFKFADGYGDIFIGFRRITLYIAPTSAPKTSQLLRSIDAATRISTFGDSDDDIRLNGGTLALQIAGTTKLGIDAGGTVSVSAGLSTTAITDLLINPTTKVSGNLFDAQVGSVSKFSVSNTGNLVLAGTLNTHTVPGGTGTLALTSDLSSYIPYTGATGNVDLGAYSLTSPLLIGGTAVGSKITYKSTTGAGTATGIAHEFLGGTDGGTSLMTILNNGNTGLGTTLGNVKFALYDGGAGSQMGFGIQSNDFRFALINSAQDFNFYPTNAGTAFFTLKGTGIAQLKSADSSALTDFLVNPTAKTSGNLIDLQVASASKFYVSSSGNVFPAGEIYLAAGQGLSTVALGGTLVLQGRNMNTPTGQTAVSMAIGTNSASSGANTAVQIVPIYNQTGTAAATDLLINRTQTAVGSGAQYLIDAQVATASKFYVTNTGTVVASGYFSAPRFTRGTNLPITMADSAITSAMTALAIGGATHTESTGQANVLSIIPTYNQTGTAAATDLLIRRTETAVGSGAQYLIDAGTVAGGSQFSVTNAGVVQQKGCVVAGTLSADTSGNIICTSDARLKNILGNYEGGLSALSQITPQLFTYKTTPSNPIETFVHAGFIAQNVMAVIPQASALQPNGYYSLDTTAILATTVNAIKEMNLNLEGIAGITIPASGSPSESFVTAFFGKIGTWLADAGNGIANIFAKEVNTNTLCVSDDTGAKTCLTKTQLDALLAGAGNSTPPPTPIPTSTPTCTAPQTLVDNVCTDPTPVVPTCVDPQILVDNVCTDPTPAPVIPPPEPTPPPVPDPIPEPAPDPIPADPAPATQ